MVVEKFCISNDGKYNLLVTENVSKSEMLFAASVIFATEVTTSLSYCEMCNL
jgi:hypothetical protein